VEQVLADPDYRNQAVRLSREIKEYNTYALCAKYVAELFSRQDRQETGIRASSCREVPSLN
jgi:UDP:flavonoid glycosyltransferase YjiC (YdhE family)